MKKASKPTILALHGFLGWPEDWSAVKSRVSSHTWLVPDLAVWATRSDCQSLTDFARAFNRKLRETGTKSFILCGYSLGARLAAHLVLDAPELFQSFLALSINPGFAGLSLETTMKAKAERSLVDQEWSRRLRNEDWAVVWRDWNDQSVLRAGSQRRASSHLIEGGVDRVRHLEGRRQAWSQAMTAWSVSSQEDLREPLMGWANGSGRELVVMTGTEDTSYTKTASLWSDSGQRFRHRTALAAGHRLLEEAADDVAGEIIRLAGLR